MRRKPTITILLVGAMLMVMAASAHGASISRTAAGVTADLSYTVERSVVGSIVEVNDLVLTVTGPGRTPQTFDTGSLRYQFPDNHVDTRTALTIRDVNGDGEPEVFLDTYTGGAHCCYEVRVAWWSPDQGRYLLTDQFWGNGLPRLQNLNRDGVLEFVGWDDRFAYAFNASYAGSTFPARVWQFRNGRFVVVTRQFPAVGVRGMNRAWSKYVMLKREYPRDRVNALAAYLAGASTAGPRYRRIAWRRVVTAERKNPAILRGLKRGAIRLGYAVG